MTELQQAAKNNALLNKKKAHAHLKHVREKYKNFQANQLELLKAKIAHLASVRFYDSFSKL